MALFFPDNDNREARIRQLVDDVHELMDQATADFKLFETLGATMTAKIQAVYAKAGLGSPNMTTLEIVSVSDTVNNVQDVKKVVTMAELFVDVGGAAAPMIFAPAATIELADAGLVSAEAAGAALSTTLGADITAGGMFGGIIGVLVATIFAGGLTLILSATSGASNANELRGGIAKAKTLREMAGLSALRAGAMVEMVKAVSASCDAILAGLQGPQQALFIENMIRHHIQPTVDALNNLNRKSAVLAMYNRDMGRTSWMKEG